MAKTKLTRKEIREDRIREALVHVYEWLGENRILLLAGVAGIILLFALTYFWENFQLSRDQEIQQRFAEALKIHHARLASEDAPDEEHNHNGPQYEFATSEERTQKALEAFTAIVEDYSGTRLGDFSRYYLAISQQNSGSSREAEETLRALIRETDSLELKNLARSYLGSVLLEQGDLDGAIEILRQILDDDSDRFPRSTVLSRLARAYDAKGDGAAALEHYQRLKAEYPGSPDAQAAQSRLDLLEAQFGKAEAEDQEGEDSGV